MGIKQESCQYFEKISSILLSLDLQTEGKSQVGAAIILSGPGGKEITDRSHQSQISCQPDWRDEEQDNIFHLAT